MTIFIVLHFVKRILWYRSVFAKFSYYCDIFCSEPASRLRERHRHGWVHYIDTKNTVLRFVWDCLVFIQYIYYRELFCSGPASGLCNRHCHMWVCYIDTTKITVVCMSLLLLSIDIQRFCYFNMLYFKLTNVAMVKWLIVKCCNG